MGLVCVRMAHMKFTDVQARQAWAKVGTLRGTCALLGVIHGRTSRYQEALACDCPDAQAKIDADPRYRMTKESGHEDS